MERRRTNPKPLPEVLSTFDADEDLEPCPADFIGPKDNALLRMRKENNDKKRAYEMMAPKDASSSHTSASVTKQQRLIRHGLSRLLFVTLPQSHTTLCPHASARKMQFMSNIWLHGSWTTMHCLQRRQTTMVHSIRITTIRPT